MNILGAIAVTIGAILVTVWFLSPVIAIGYFIAFMVSTPTNSLYLVAAGIFTAIALSLIGALAYRWKTENASADLNGKWF